MERLTSFLGLFVMIALAWAMSSGRRSVRWRPVAWGVALQFAFALLLLSPGVRAIFFDGVDGAVRRMLSFAEAGATFVFQSLVPHTVLGPDGAPITGPDGAPVVYVGQVSPATRTFAFWVLPSIVFFSSLMRVGYHVGLMQRVVWALGWLMQRTLGVSGAESLAASANVFVGQTEAPLLVRPYVATMTRSELFSVMVGGFATVSGGIMAAYVGFLERIPGIAGHLVTASILSAPAALAIAKVMEPEREEPVTAGRLSLSAVQTPDGDRNVLEAAARGATEGMSLAINVAAMLIAFVALVAMGDWVLGLVPVGGAPLSLARVLGVAFAPLAFAMGVPWHEAGEVGRLLGEKMVLTEFIAYVHLGEQLAGPDPISTRSAVIASYALCGFANFASIGIQLGGIGAMAPERMGDLAAIGFRAMLGGSLAAFMTACVAGVFLPA